MTRVADALSVAVGAAQAAADASWGEAGYRGRLLISVRRVMAPRGSSQRQPILDGADRKECASCGEIKSLAEFYFCKGHALPYCKLCHIEKSKAWYRNNRDKARVQARERMRKYARRETRVLQIINANPSWWPTPLVHGGPTKLFLFKKISDSSAGMERRVPACSINWCCPFRTDLCRDKCSGERSLAFGPRDFVLIIYGGECVLKHVGEYLFARHAIVRETRKAIEAHDSGGGLDGYCEKPSVLGPARHKKSTIVF
jgi:hypothetical protein